MTSVPSITYNIWIAGDYQDAIRACREFCEEGLCVTVTKTDFVYTGGLEEGVCVGVRNYPRFPSTPEKLLTTSKRLAAHLQSRLYQDSYLIEGPNATYWISRRGSSE